MDEKYSNGSVEKRDFEIEVRNFPAIFIASHYQGKILEWIYHQLFSMRHLRF